VKVVVSGETALWEARSGRKGVVNVVKLASAIPAIAHVDVTVSNRKHFLIVEQRVKERCSATFHCSDMSCRSGVDINRSTNVTGSYRTVPPYVTRSRSNAEADVAAGCARLGVA
jgi:hypothetical protein